MKGRFVQLLAPTTVIPDVPGWGAQTLGIGSVVFVASAEDSKPGVVCPAHEQYVRWFDLLDRKNGGWISKYVPTKSAKPGLVHVGYDERSPTSALDSLRYRMFQSNLTPVEWAGKFLDDSRAVDDLLGFLRERGKRVKSSNADWPAIALSEFTQEEVTMSDVRSKRRKAKKGTDAPVVKTSRTKKAKKEGTGRVHTLDRSTGEELAQILPAAPGGKKLMPLAQRLVGGEVLSKKDLTTLRDGINASAAAARENGKANTASKLSNANRLVRRLWRRA